MGQLVLRMETQEGEGLKYNVEGVENTTGIDGTCQGSMH